MHKQHKNIDSPEHSEIHDLNFAHVPVWGGQSEMFFKAISIWINSEEVNDSKGLVSEVSMDVFKLFL